MTIKSMDWYLKEFGEDWAQIVREEDLRLEAENEKLQHIASASTTFDKSTSWAFNEISGQ